MTLCADSFSESSERHKHVLVAQLVLEGKVEGVVFNLGEVLANIVQNADSIGCCFTNNLVVGHKTKQSYKLVIDFRGKTDTLEVSREFNWVASWQILEILRVSSCSGLVSVNNTERESVNTVGVVRKSSHQDVSAKDIRIIVCCAKSNI